MNWDEMLDEYCTTMNCNLKQYSLAEKTKSKDLRRMKRDRNNAFAAMNAVKKAYEENPGASREEVRKQSYKFITSSAILSIILSAILYTAICKAIEWFIDRMYNKETLTY
jgi:hypothetical protein